MTDAARDNPVCVFARELFAIRVAVRVWRTIGITFKGDRRHGDDRTFGKPILQIIVLRVAFGQADSPAVVMDHDGDVVRVVERRRGAIERGIIELPPRRSDLPNELGKIAPVFVVAERAAFGGKVVPDTTTGTQPLAATASGWLQGCRSGNH